MSISVFWWFHLLDDPAVGRVAPSFEEVLERARNFEVTCEPCGLWRNDPAAFARRLADDDNFGYEWAECFPCHDDYARRVHDGDLVGVMPEIVASAHARGWPPAAFAFAALGAEVASVLPGACGNFLLPRADVSRVHRTIADATRPPLVPRAVLSGQTGELERSVETLVKALAEADARGTALLAYTASDQFLEDEEDY